MADNKEWMHISEALEGAFEYMQKLKENLPEKKERYYETLQSFKTYYQHHEKYIIKAAIENKCRCYDAHPIEWETVLSPIELQLWYIIRCTGRIVLYPQYPVGPYFADFANPYLKIIVEVDGKDYHLDKEKDRRRDYEMKHNGWTVFRLTGAEVYKGIDFHLAFEDERDEMFSDWINETGEGLIYALKAFYFEDEDMFNHKYSADIRRALKNHSDYFTC